MRNTLRDAFGLHFQPGFFRDRQFYLAMALAPLPLLALSLLVPNWNAGLRYGQAAIFALVFWQPLVEELLFRGFIQGHLTARASARRKFVFLSLANYCTTLLFVLAHLVHHSPWWAVAVAVPSLVFGHFRDRHGQIYPALILHAAYNACYLMAVGMRHGG